MTRKNEPTKRKSPASGERRAVRSFSAQYRVAAALAYEALQAGELEWIQLADPEAGRLDDIVIARPRRLDAYQVKWENYEQRITFKDLVSDSLVGGSPYPSPMSILGDGWQRLRDAYPDREINVHYLSKASPSSSDVTGGTPTDDAKHLQAFLRNAFDHRTQWFDSAFAGARADWATPIEAMLKATGIPASEHERFLANCHFDLGYRLPFDDKKGVADPKSRDQLALAELFQKKVASEEKMLLISKQELIRLLGWSRRFEFEFKHDFPVDEHLYRPVQATIEAIESAFKEYKGGYLALIGPPGSGKSTTLTQMLRYRQGVRTIRYYAYVRDDIRQGRGEAESFLHDLCLSIEGSVGNMFRRLESKDYLQERLTSLFAILHKDWHENHVRTILLIDGLDHIEREQSPIRSLVEVLPHPNSIPEGVLIVLGTQRAGLESEAAALRPIRSQLKAGNRTITMGKLSRADVYGIIGTAISPELLEPGNSETIFTLSAGHPLALTYLVKRLSACTDKAALQTILPTLRAYSDDIEEEYHAYWDALSSDWDVRDLLGLVSRIRGSIDLKVLRQLTNLPTLDRFVHATRQYFDAETPSQWTFFHNSFRQFLLRATARDSLGDDGPGKAFHARLARSAAEAPAGTPWSWEQIHHLHHACDKAGVLDAITQSRFRAQYFGLRPIYEIREDLERGVQAAASLGEAMPIVRALLIDHELSERQDALSEVGLPKLLLNLADIDSVPDVVFDGPELRVPKDTALEFSATILKAGSENLARRLFDLAEPLDTLSGATPAEGRDLVDLRAWARVAWLFRPLTEIFSVLRRLKISEERNNPDPFEAGRNNDSVRGELLLEIGRQAILQQNEELLLQVQREILTVGKDADHILQALEQAKVKAVLGGEYPVPDGIAALKKLLEKTPAPPPEVAVQFADAALRLLDDKLLAEKLMTGATNVLKVARIDYDESKELARFTPLLVQARVLAVLGRPMDPVDLLPEPKSRDDLGGVLFQRLLVLIGTVWGLARSGSILAPSELTRRLKPALGFFQRPWTETQKWSDWHAIEQKAPAFYRAILCAAEAHGPAALASVFEWLSQDWKRTPSNARPGWRPDWKRLIAMAAHDLHKNLPRTTGILDQLEDAIDIHSDLHDRISELSEHIWARIQLGQVDKARTLLNQMLRTSFGIYHRKDTQLSKWADWAARFAQLCDDTTIAKKTLGQLLKTIPIQSSTGRGDEVEAATGRLLASAAELDHEWAYGVAKHFLDTGSAKRTAVISGVVAGCVASGNQDAVEAGVVATTRLLIPFETETSQNLQDAIAVRLKNFPGLASLPDLRRALDLKAFAGNRRQWLSSLELPSQVEDDRGDVDDEDEFNEDYGSEAEEDLNGLSMPDGTVLDNAALLEKSAEKSAFLEIISTAVSGSKIKWPEVVQNALPHLALPSELQFAYGHLERLGAKGFVHSQILERAIELGAEGLVASALTALHLGSKRQGWAQIWDGGTRLAYAKGLIAARGKAGRHQALELFANDYVEGLDVRNLVNNLDDVLGIFFADMPVTDVWQELSDHISQLADIAEIDALPYQATTVTSASPTSTIIALLFDDMRSPVLDLAREARRGLRDLVLRRYGLAEIEARAKALLRSEGAELLAGVVLVATIYETNPDWVKGLQIELVPLAWSPSAVVRRIVQPMLIALEIPFKEGGPSTQIPAIYKLELPKAQMRETSSRGAPPAGAALPDTTDSYDLSSMFHGALKRLAQDEGPSFEAMVNRFASLMKEISPPESWSNAYETKLGETLSAIGLSSTFRRPRSLAAQLAFAHLVAELVDAGLAKWPNADIDEWLMPLDPVSENLEPQPRPAWLSLQKPGEAENFKSRGWAQRIAENLDLPQKRTPVGGMVLAEMTTIESHEHGKPRETRVSMIAHREWPIPPKEELDLSWFAFSRRYFPAEYPVLHRLSKKLMSAVSGEPYFADAGFLALNPVLANSLGWEPSDQGLFRWVDAEGQTMAESIYWQEGNCNHRGTYGFHEIGAQGWLVVATPDATIALQDAFQYCRRVTCIERHFREQFADTEHFSELIFGAV